MRKYGLLCAGVLLMGASLSFAQAKPDSVCEINVTTPKAGAAKAFEAARTKHNDFHKAEKDKHAIMVWEITTGPATGKYLTAVCGMTWKDFDGNDAMDQRDAADRMKTMAPTVESNEASYYVYRADLSSGTEGSVPAKMMTVVHFFVKPGSTTQFADSVKRINAAHAQTKSAAKPARWYVLANGGMGPHFVQVIDRNSWADMQGPDKTLADTLKEAYGADDKTLQTARDAIDHTVSELLEYRAEMSYIPSK